MKFLIKSVYPTFTKIGFPGNLSGKTALRFTNKLQLPLKGKSAGIIV